jgi:CRP/FNR family cyclic AMP-dependent transcriptional regulator
MAEADQLFARFGEACPAGTVLFEEGDDGSTMYVLQSGRVRITKGVGDEEKVLAILGPGEFFGEMATVQDEAKLLLIDAKTFEQMVVSNTEIAVRLIKKMARRLDSADALIEVLMHRDPKARVILGLSREVSVTGVPLDDGAVVVPMGREGLADQVGLDEAAVADVFKRLARLGIIEERSDGTVVHDVTRLHEFLEFLEMKQKFGEP